MKILKGTLKGRNISAPLHTRPLLVTVRKACFDILGVLEEARILDLFAGSGALGIEALSVGAKEVTFVDIRKAAIEAVKKNLTQCKMSAQARVILKDFSKAVKDFHQRGEEFDFIFLDPPYYKDMLRKALQDIEAYDILSTSGYIIGFCSTKDEILEESDRFELIVRKKYGQTQLIIYRKKHA